jgi:hypothetical protein
MKIAGAEALIFNQGFFIFYLSSLFLKDVIIHKTAKRAALIINIKIMEKKAKPETEETFEEVKVSGKKLVDKVKELLKEGNARKIIIKDEKGEIMLSLPLTIGAAGVLLAPTLAAVGGLAALITHCTLTVVKTKK